MFKSALGCIKLSIYKALVGLIKVYRCLLSPWVGQHCRFDPTCSVYAEQALAKHGIMRGLWLTLKRLLRCHPFCHGGYDPVPEENK